MLDTDSASYALRADGDVGARIAAHTRSDLMLSAITLGELRFGADVKRSRKLHRLIDVLAAEIAVMAFDASAAASYARIAARLRAAGRPIGMADAMLAGHAASLGATMVTRNVRHFARVSGLRVENWY